VLQNWAFGGAGRAGGEDRESWEYAALDVRAEGDPTAANLFNMIACLQEQEGVRLRVVV
jgi:hypothetical protein